RDLSVADRREIAISKLTQVGLDVKSYDKLPSELSGGMRKRCGLARALALDPEIILYDEPTTGLDPIMTETVDNLILCTHNHREGVTSVVITHDLFAAFRLAHFVAMLDNGKVLLSGTPQDFLKSDIDLVKRFVEKGMKHS
ncbi:MAG: ATP-binding cassette domain-containing protein, partial [Bdellovibrionales bacterium]|nr:ATP-binding cassette domain-containing protein [Bdellovibrionales bacterium]